MKLPWSKASAFEDKEPVSSTDSLDHDQMVPTAETTTQLDNEKDIVDANVEPATRTLSTASSAIDDESKYLTGIPLYLLSLGLFLATFVVALDNTIIATAIPRITTVFDSLNDVGWYGSSYLLTTACLQPTFGKIYTYFNVKWTYLFALAIFEVGSVLCGAAINSKMLIVGRAVAGVGASALFSGGMSIVGYSVPLRQRPIYIGILSSTFGIASIVGPILGGAFTDKVSWRWCFYINVPIGVIAMTTVFFVFRNPERKESKLTFKQKLGQMDLAGAFFLIGAICCLLLALQWGGSVYPWHDSKVWGCFVGFGILIVIFAVIQVYSGDKATLPPRILIKQRTVLACALFSAFLSMALYTHIYYLPFYFQAVKGTTAEQSGIHTIPFLVSNTLAAIAVGGTITAVGKYVPFTWVGSALYVVGAGLLYTLQPTSSAGKWIGYQLVAGFGAGACVQIPFIAVQVVLNKKDMPTGNAIPIFFNTLGGALSISIAQNIFSNGLVKYIPRYAPGVDPQIVIAAGATHIKEVVSAAQLPGVLLAYNAALTHAFLLSVATGILAFLCSFLFEWKSVKKGQMIGSAGA